VESVYVGVLAILEALSQVIDANEDSRGASVGASSTGTNLLGDNRPAIEYVV